MDQFFQFSAISSAIFGRFFPAEIVGGDEPAEPIPWQVSVQRYNSHICGATIIDDKVLLSAASCFYNEEDLDTADDLDDFQFKDYKYSIKGLTIRAGSEAKSYGGQVCFLIYIP